MVISINDGRRDVWIVCEKPSDAIELYFEDYFDEIDEYFEIDEEGTIKYRLVSSEELEKTHMHCHRDNLDECEICKNEEEIVYKPVTAFLCENATEPYIICITD